MKVCMIACANHTSGRQGWRATSYSSGVRNAYSALKYMCQQGKLKHENLDLEDFLEWLRHWSPQWPHSKFKCGSDKTQIHRAIHPPPRFSAPGKLWLHFPSLQKHFKTPSDLLQSKSEQNTHKLPLWPPCEHWQILEFTPQWRPLSGPVAPTQSCVQSN